MDISKSTTLKPQYTQTNPEDTYNIANGLCPDYALYWGIKENKKYWPENYNFLYKNLPMHSSKEYNILRSILNKKYETNDSRPILYCELDDILVDLEKGITNLLQTGYASEEYPPSLLQRILRNTPNFYSNLEWTANGKELWSKIKKYKPIILTRKTHGAYQYEEGKRQWCAENLGEDIQVITCFSHDKPKYCIKNSILIDTKDRIKEQWELLLGKFIHYNTSLSDQQQQHKQQHKQQQQEEEIINAIDIYMSENI